MLVVSRGLVECWWSISEVLVVGEVLVGVSGALVGISGCQWGLVEHWWALVVSGVLVGVGGW